MTQRRMGRPDYRTAFSFGTPVSDPATVGRCVPPDIHLETTRWSSFSRNRRRAGSTALRRKPPFSAVVEKENLVKNGQSVQLPVKRQVKAGTSHLPRWGPPPHQAPLPTPVTARPELPKCPSPPRPLRRRSQPGTPPRLIACAVGAPEAPPPTSTLAPSQFSKCPSPPPPLRLRSSEPGRSGLSVRLNRHSRPIFPAVA